MTATVTNFALTRTPDYAGTRFFVWGDYIRVFGTLVVICQHVAHRTTLFDTADVSSFNWWSIMSLEAACRWAVPVFVMLSGALLLDPTRAESPSSFYRRRFLRIGVPLVVWSLFYTLPRVAAHGFSSEAMAEVGARLAHGRPAYHMYFLFVIAGLYMLTPYLRIVIQGLSQAELRTAWVGLLILAWGAGLLNTIFGHELIVLTEFIPYLGYYLAGYELRNVRLSARGTLIAGAVIGLAIALMVAVTLPLVDRFGVTTGTRYLYDYFGPTVIVLSISLYLVALTMFDRPREGSLGRWVTWAAPATLGIYLMHPALLMAQKLAEKRGLVPTWDPTVGSILLTTVVVFMVCWLTTAVFQRVPVLRTAVG